MPSAGLFAAFLKIRGLLYVWLKRQVAPREAAREQRSGPLANIRGVLVSSAPAHWPKISGDGAKKSLDLPIASLLQEMCG
jgi:hypothetical protein